MAAGIAAAPGSEGRDPWRPLYHFAPERHWINDPNGLVYAHGEYHLFFQHNPRGERWGHMSWGHAVSPDLLSWSELPLALEGDEGARMYFSGSAVVDRANTAGFASAGEPALVAVYTAVAGGIQRQEIAFSLDRGRSWTEYGENPVLDLGSREFRDPKVFWHEPGSRWVMVVSRGAERRLQLYASRDLVSWEHLSDFGPDSVPVKNWECPDLFELPVEGAPGETRWVLQIDVGDGAVAGGSGGRYLVGDFDGTRFVPDGPGDELLWVDHGPDFYAAQSWSDAPDGRRLWVAWMSNWDYAAETPTAGWRGAMSVPREVGLRRFAEGVRLVQRPVAELEAWRQRPVEVGGADLAASNARLSAPDARGTALDLEVALEPAGAEVVGVAVRRGAGEETRVGYDARSREVFLDRTRSGAVGFHPAFPGRYTAPLQPEGGRVRLRILVDASSVEVFAGGGRVSITASVFPQPASDGVAAFAEGGVPAEVSVRLWRLRPPP